MTVEELVARIIAQVGKKEAMNYVLSHYAPPRLDDVLHDGLVDSGSTIGSILGATAGVLGGGTIGGRPGAIAGGAILAPAGSLAGAWAAHGAYREGQVINNIITHPENWSVDAAGAIVPVLPDPDSSSTTNQPNDAGSQSVTPAQGDAATIAAGESGPSTRFLASRRLNSNGEPITPWRFPSVGPSPSTQPAASQAAHPDIPVSTPPTFQVGYPTIGPSNGAPPAGLAGLMAQYMRSNFRGND